MGFMLTLPINEEVTSHINAGGTRLGRSQSEATVIWQDIQND